jgi:hypothetical protein
MNKLITSIAIALFATSAQAFDFKGVEINSAITPSEVAEKLGSTPRCRTAPQIFNKQVCMFETTLVGEPVKAFLVYGDDGTIIHMFIHFKASEYDAIEVALTDKFGEGKCEDGTVTTNGGATFTNSKCSWVDGAGNELYVERYATNVTRGVMMMNTTAYNNMVGNSLNADKKDI